MDNQKNFPFDFDSNACESCRGKCCRGSGGHVWVSKKELKRIADKKKMDIALFAKKYVRKVKGRLSLKENYINSEHLCCFFDHIDYKCTIYKNRPRQCRTFPFWDEFRKEFRDLLFECPGVILKDSGQ
jgi:uncharacterized protein